MTQPSSRRPCRYLLVGAAILLLPLAAAHAQSGRDRFRASSFHQVSDEHEWSREQRGRRRRALPAGREIAGAIRPRDGSGVRRFWNGAGHGRHGEFVQSITVGHALARKMNGHAEFFSGLGTERHAGWVGTVDAGVAYLIAENIQLDAGCNFGVTHAADDFNPFTGISIRF